MAISIYCSVVSTICVNIYEAELTKIRSNTEECVQSVVKARKITMETDYSYLTLKIRDLYISQIETDMWIYNFSR